MIDNFAILVTHGLMLLACWILLKRPDLDREPRAGDPKPWARCRSPKAEERA